LPLRPLVPLGAVAGGNNPRGGHGRGEHPNNNANGWGGPAGELNYG
jgi:hypothetical protein